MWSNFVAKNITFQTFASKDGKGLDDQGLGCVYSRLLVMSSLMIYQSSKAQSASERASVAFLWLSIWPGAYSLTMNVSLSVGYHFRMFVQSDCSCDTVCYGPA